MEVLATDKRIILKWILKECIGRYWAVLIWLKREKRWRLF